MVHIVGICSTSLNPLLYSNSHEKDQNTIEGADPRHSMLTILLLVDMMFLMTEWGFYFRSSPHPNNSALSVQNLRNKSRTPETRPKRISQASLTFLNLYPNTAVLRRNLDDHSDPNSKTNKFHKGHLLTPLIFQLIIFLHQLCFQTPTLQTDSSIPSSPPCLTAHQKA